jgi:sensor domain DACNV-containing protein
MTQPAYAVARVVAPTVAEHLQLHRAALPPHDPLRPPLELLPDARAIELIVDAAFWASLRREEGYIPKISLAFLRPMNEIHPLIFAKPLPLEPSALTRLAAAVERPGIHLGVWPAKVGSQSDPTSQHWPGGPPSRTAPLMVWGTTHMVPPFCFVVEVIAPGLLVLKHRPRHESRKFVNVAVLEGDRIKIVDERASQIVDCPTLLTSMLGFDASVLSNEALNVQVQLALSMRRHGRGGILLVVPPGTDAWRESIVHPITYGVEPAFGELAELLAQHGDMPDHEWDEATGRAIDALAGLTAVDGATVITARYELLAFGAKITRRRGGAVVEQIMVTEPVEGGTAELMHPGQLGGTRHLSAAQFVHDLPGAVALVASQDGRFTIFAWSPCDKAVHAHRVEVLLL